MKYTIKSGELDRLVTIQDDVGVKDEYGQTTTVWQDVHTDIPCGITFIKGHEQFESTQEVANLTTDFKIRFIEGITPRMRLVFEGEIYDIKRVIEITRRKGYVIQAQFKDNG